MAGYQAPVRCMLGIDTEQQMLIMVLRSQGRFSGRLTSKADEERLVQECALLGPLLGGLPGCDGACDTLSRIVRSIACGDLRLHLEAKETTLQVLSVYLQTAS